MSKSPKLKSKPYKLVFWSKTLTGSTENLVLAEKTLRQGMIRPVLDQNIRNQARNERPLVDT